MIPEPELIQSRSVVVLVSANSEWEIVLSILNPAKVDKTPLGDCFIHQLAGDTLLFLHSGWGKVRSAAAAQYVIDTFNPQLMINLGTCGGFEGYTQIGEILLAESMVIYDIFERMGDPEDAIDRYRSRLDTSWLPESLPEGTRRATIGSADQDIDFNNYNLLTEKFMLTAADWESAPIGWVAQTNRVSCLILRGVSDLVGPNSSETDANHALWKARARQIMHKLLDDLPFYLKSFSELQN